MSFKFAGQEAFPEFPTVNIQVRALGEITPFEFVRHSAKFPDSFSIPQNRELQGASGVLI